MIKAKVDEKIEYLINKLSDQYIVNGKHQSVDIRKIDDTSYHIIHNHKSINVRIVNIDPDKKKIELRISGQSHFVELLDEEDQLLAHLNRGVKKMKRVDVLKAPMAGLIMDIKINEEDVVREGDPLITLKAMKMENIIKSPYDGTIKRIFVEENDTVEKDTPILQF